MRDPDLMLNLLREMAHDPGGQMMAVRTMGMSNSQRAEYHHLELLVDAGHAQWTGSKQNMARITNDGYDFLNAVEHGKGTKDRFVELFNNGVPYVKAALEALKLTQSAL